MNTLPRRCPWCGGPKPVKGGCPKPPCVRRQREEWRARDARRRQRKLGRCRICTWAPVEGSRFCERHQVMPLPCPICGGQVARPERGRLPIYCKPRHRDRAAYEWWRSRHSCPGGSEGP